MTVQPKNVKIVLGEGNSISLEKVVTDIPVVVEPRVTSDAALSVTFTPASITTTNGRAKFDESITVRSNATPGSELTAHVDFLVNGTHREGFQQTVTVDVPKHATKLSVDSGRSPFNMPGTLRATLIDDVTKRAISGAQIDFTMGLESCHPTTNDHGVAECTITPRDQPGTYPIHASYAGDSRYLDAHGANSYEVLRHETALNYTGTTSFGIGDNSVSAVLEDTLENSPVAGRKVDFRLADGSTVYGTAEATTDARGLAQANMKLSALPGGANLKIYASFRGDVWYEPSRASESAWPAVYFPSTGAFVVSTQNPNLYSTDEPMQFWGSQWWKENPVGGKHSEFMGFAHDYNPGDSTWAASPGNSEKPPTAIPEYMAIIVTDQIDAHHGHSGQHGADEAERKGGQGHKPKITGNVVKVIAVKVDLAQYEPNPGHHGCGTYICDIADPGSIGRE